MTSVRYIPAYVCTLIVLLVVLLCCGSALVVVIYIVYGNLTSFGMLNGIKSLSLECAIILARLRYDHCTSICMWRQVVVSLVNAGIC